MLKWIAVDLTPRAHSAKQSIELFEKIQSLEKEWVGYAGLDFLTFGPSIITLPNAEHAVRRKCLVSSFKNVKCMSQVIERHTQTMLNDWEKQRTRIDILHSVTLLTFTVILEFTFGMTVERATVQSLMADFAFMLEASWEVVKWPILTSIRMRIPGEFKTRQHRCKQGFETLIDAAKRVGNPESILQSFLDAGLSNSEILSEMMVSLGMGVGGKHFPAQ